MVLGNQLSLEQTGYSDVTVQFNLDTDEIDIIYLNNNHYARILIAQLSDGQVPNLKINMSDRSAYTLGKLFYFFEFACGISGYLLGVNPFNQPGVESYKKNMFALLGQPGFEEQREELLKRL